MHLHSRRYADVAQLVEHFTRNEGVRGSNPRVGSGRPCTRGSSCRTGATYGAVVRTFTDSVLAATVPLGVRASIRTFQTPARLRAALAWS